ncbi:MAG: hypothetical protein HQL06_15330 [Nitrospirae bacterium]|nr:hypothetical protein [Nitrospirota bacterium]
MAITALIVVFVIGPRLRRSLKNTVNERKDSYTIEELTRFDGNEGRAAYVGYDGNVYDVSNSRLWKAGKHVGKHQAGIDMTELLKTAPHGDDMLKRVPLVGKLTVSATAPQMPAYMKVFYFFAYMNLALVFLIVFVISLWRWW